MFTAFLKKKKIAPACNQQQKRNKLLVHTTWMNLQVNTFNEKS